MLFGAGGAPAPNAGPLDADGRVSEGEHANNVTATMPNKNLEAICMAPRCHNALPFASVYTPWIFPLLPPRRWGRIPAAPGLEPHGDLKMTRHTPLLMTLAFVLSLGCSSSDGSSETGEDDGSEDAEETAGDDTADADTGDTDTEDADTGDTETGETDTEDAETGETDAEDAETGETDAEDAETGETDAEDAETGGPDIEDAETGGEPEDTVIPDIPDAEGCQLELRTRINGTVFWQANEGDNIELQAHVRNLTNDDLPLTVKDFCPAGVAAFQGLPEGYDYYTTCAAGACPDLPPQVFIIPANQTVIIAAPAINLSGGTCNDPVPPALTYEINYSVTTFEHDNPNLCNGASFSASLTVCEGVCPD